LGERERDLKRERGGGIMSVVEVSGRNQRREEGERKEKEKKKKLNN